MRSGSKRAAPRVRLVIFDFDGVLTDNRVLVHSNGSESVCCNRADGLAFDTLRAAHIPAIIVSTERNPVVSARARKLRVPVLQGVADKGVAVTDYCRQHDIGLGDVAYLGNDVNDLPAMRIVGHPAAVGDAHPQVRKAARYRLKTRGGDGAARELVTEVLGIATVERLQDVRVARKPGNGS